MDPWYPHPYDQDLLLFPNIDEVNAVMIEKILDYLPHLRHPVVSVATKFSVHPKLTHLENMRNDCRRARDYMSEHDLSDIVYLGFHHGYCIITKPDGAGQMRRWYRCWLKRDLACDFPDDKTEILDRESRRFLTWI